MDNLSAHKTQIVRDNFKRLGCNAIFAPPYSPEFNSIELYFSYLKRKRRKIMAKTNKIYLNIVTIWFQK